MSISLFVKKKKKILHLFLSLLKKKFECLGFLAYLWFYFTSDFLGFYLFIFFLHFLYVELVSGAALTLK